MRKPQTAAGFVPKARETQARKTLETWPTEPTKKKEKNASSKENLGARYAPLESLRKQLEIWPWTTASESLKQQQDSCPKHAKRKPEKLSKRCLRNPLKRKKKMPPARKTLAPGTPLWNRYESNSKSGLGQPHPKASNSSRIRAQRLMQQQPPASIVCAQECSVCKSERASKALVLRGKLRDANFAAANAILPTNAVKYHVNKLRAQEWAKQHQERIRYAIGQDRISSAALREKPDLMNEKLEWLQRHDQECGGLCGVLPICMGLPVRATDHLDRAKGILRGCRGVVVGWSHEPVTESSAQGDAIIWNTLPVAIYVRFDTAATWVIDGLQQANVYPVSPQRKQWHLDKHRQRPVLRVTRRQYPLAPAFAITAHAAQGQTAKGQVVADLHIGPHGDPLTAYVAVTRVTGRNKLAILRPFDPKPYQQGTRLGRVLLLRVWRGEEIDWDALRATYLEEKPCAECTVRKRKNEYTAGQWKRTDDKRICKECVARHVENGEPWQ